MKVTESLREWSDSTEEWAELVAEQNRWDSDDVFHGSAADAVVSATRIADLLDSYADRMERSGLVRVWASSFTPAGLRERAVGWRARAAEWATS